MVNNEWKELYRLVDKWNELQAWQEVWSSDLVAIEFPGEETYYCTIMGKLGDCIGLSIYQGDEGYADLCSISQEYPDMAVMKYVMFEQNCLTFYMGDRNEIPDEQKKIIKGLGLKYQGKGQWPYFISYKRRFQPHPIHNKQASVFVKVMERLIDIMEEYLQHNIDVNFDDGEIIYAYVEDDKWIYESRYRPELIDKYIPVSLSNKDYLKELNSFKQLNNAYIIDLVYLPQYIEENNYGRPLSTLAIIVLDASSQMIMQMRILEPKEDEITACIQTLCELIEKSGKPQAILIRNPQVYCALADLCEICHIKMQITVLDVVDEIVSQMADML